MCAKNLHDIVKVIDDGTYKAEAKFTPPLTNTGSLSLQT